MQLLFVIVLLSAVLSAELVSTEPVANGGLRVLLTAAAVALVMLFAQVAAGITSLRLQCDFTQRTTLMRNFARWKTLHLVAWACGSAAILFGLEWTRLVRVNWQLAGTFMLDEILILLPVITPLIFSWAAFYEVDRTLDRYIASGRGTVACGRATTSWLPGCFRYVLTHVRHHLGLLLIPLLAVVAFQDAALWLLPDVPGGELPLVAYLPLLAGMVVLLPCLLRLVWPTQPLAAGELRSRLLRVSDQLGVSVREIFVWKTNRMITNAAVAGVLPRLRYVFLSDSLLASLRDDQIAAIYAHELGHVRHRHLALRVITSLLPLAVWMAACVTFPTAIANFDAFVGGMGWPVAAASPLLLLVVMAIYARTVMAAYSRLLEHEADLAACRDLERDGHPTPAAADPCAADPCATDRCATERCATEQCATEQYIATLKRLTLLSGQSLQRRSWLHPSAQERICFLHTMAAQAASPAAFHAGMRRLARLFVTLFALAIGWWAVAAMLQGLG